MAHGSKSNQVRFTKNMAYVTNDVFLKTIRKLFMDFRGVKGTTEFVVTKSKLHKDFQNSIEKEHDCILPTQVKLIYGEWNTKPSFSSGSYRRTLVVDMFKGDHLKLKAYKKSSNNIDINILINSKEYEAMKKKAEYIKEQIFYKDLFSFEELFAEIVYKIWVSIVTVSNHTRKKDPTFLSCDTYRLYFRESIMKSVYVTHEVDLCHVTPNLLKVVKEQSPAEYNTVLSKARSKNPTLLRKKILVEFDVPKREVYFTVDRFDSELKEKKYTLNYDSKDWDVCLYRIADQIGYTDEGFRFMMYDNITFKGHVALNLKKLKTRIQNKFNKAKKLSEMERKINRPT